MDLSRKLDELTRHTNHLLNTVRSSHHFDIPAPQIYPSPTRFVSESPARYPYLGGRYEPNYRDQITYRPRYDPNDFNVGWGAQPNSSWQPHPVAAPGPQRHMFINEPEYDLPYTTYQPSPSFEEKVLSLLERIENNCQSLQTPTELDTQLGQLTFTFGEGEKREIPTQFESNTEGQYLTTNITVPEIFPDQLTANFGNEQPCPTRNNQTQGNIFRENFDWWDEQILVSSQAPVDPFSITQEAPNYFYEEERQIDDRMEFIETSQGSLKTNTRKEVKPITFESFDALLMHLGVDIDNEDGNISKMSKPVEIPNLETTSVEILEHEPLPNLLIAPMFESPLESELKFLPDVPDEVPITLNQEDQLVGVLNTYKKVIGWKMLKADLKPLIDDLSSFGTTFENSLHNLTLILKRCMETDLILTWKRCHDKTQEGLVQLKEKRGTNQVKYDNNFNISSLLFHQHKFLPDKYKNNFEIGHVMFVQCIILIRVNHRRVLYGRFSAMITRPPDWPYSFGAMREMLDLINRKTPS